MLEGKFVKLRYFEESDLAFLTSLRGSSESYDYFFEYEPINSIMQKRWWSSTVQRSNEKNFVVAEIESNDPIGTIALVDIDYRNRKCEFGRFYIKSNIITAGVESEYLLLKYAFDHLNLHKIYCISFEHNSSVISLHKRFGFVDEGLLKRHIFHNGEYRNVVIQSLFRDAFLSKAIKIQNTINKAKDYK